MLGGDFVFYGFMLWILIRRRFKTAVGETNLKAPEIQPVDKAQIDDDARKEIDRVNDSECKDILIVNDLVKCYYKED